METTVARFRRGSTAAPLIAVAALVLGLSGAAQASPQTPAAGHPAAPSAEPWTGTASQASTSTGSVIAARLANGGIKFWWSNFGQEIWHPETVAVAAHGRTYGHPDVAWTGKSVVVVAADSAGHLDLWWEAQFSNTWHHETVASRGYSVLGYDANDVAAVRGGLDIAAETAHGDVYSYVQANGSTRWHRQLVSDSLNLAAITWTGSVTGITADDSNGPLYYLWEKPGSTTWHKERIAKAATSGAWVGYPDVMAARRTIVVTASDSGGHLYAWFQRPGRTAWHREQIGGRPQWGQPTIAWTGHAVVIAGISNILQGSVYVWTQRSGGTSWVQQRVALAQPPAGSYTAPMVSATSKQITLVSLQGANIWFWSRPVNRARWTATSVGSI